jgi:DNA-binding NarL/FixJ family response regulator
MISNMSTNDSTHIVGRDEELELLNAALEASDDSSGRVIAISGEPGIGKTHLSKSISDQNLQSGGASAWGHALEEGGTPPYWVWSQIFETLTNQFEDSVLRESFVSDAGLLAEVAPVIRSKILDVKPPVMSDSDEIRFRIFDAVSNALLRLAEHKTLVLVLEDLHWADEASLRLFEYLVTRVADAKVLILATYRDVELRRRHPLSRTLAGISRSTGFERLRLSRFDYESTSELALLLGAKPDSNLFKQVFDSTEGNPFFITEVIQLFHGQNGEQRIPEGVREAIGRRLDVLSDDTNDVLEVAAVSGRSFSPNLLIALLSDRFVSGDVLRIIGLAIDARILEQDSHSVGNVRFVHSLIHEVLLEEIALHDLVSAHARVLEVKKEFYGGSDQEHSDELYEHAKAAQAIVGSYPVVHYAAVSAQKAFRAGAAEEALQYVSDVLELVRTVDLDVDIVRLLASLVPTIIWWVPPGNKAKIQAADLLSTVFDYFEQNGYTQEAIDSASPAFGTFNLNLYPLLERASKLVGDSTPQAAWIHSRAGITAADERDDYDLALLHLKKALEIADQLDDLESRMTARGMLALVHYWYGAYDEALNLAAEIRAVAPNLQSKLPMGHAAESTVFVHFSRGDIEEAIRLSDFVLEAGLSRGETARFTSGAIQKIGFQITAGKLSEALATLDFVATKNSLAAAVFGIRAAVNYHLGDVENAEADLRSAQKLQQVLRGASEPTPIDVMQRRNWVPFIATALNIGVLDGYAKELGLVREAYGQWSVDLQRGRTYHRTQEMCLAIDAVVRSDKDQASHWFEVFDPDDEEKMFYGPEGSLEMVCYISRHRLMGHLCLAAENQELALKWFELAVNNSKTKGQLLNYAYACYELAYLLVNSETTGSFRRTSLDVEQLIMESTETANQIRLKPLLIKISELKSGLPSSQFSSSSNNPAGLTEREIEVLQELSLGKSNREIAEALFITQNTVIRHVANIFAKTGSSNRAQAAVYASEHDIRP